MGENEYFTQARICQLALVVGYLGFFVGGHTKALLHLPLCALPVSASPFSSGPLALFHLHSITFCYPKYGRETLRNLGRGFACFVIHTTAPEF